MNYCKSTNLPILCTLFLKTFSSLLDLELLHSAPSDILLSPSETLYHLTFAIVTLLLLLYVDGKLLFSRKPFPSHNRSPGPTNSSVIHDAIQVLFYLLYLLTQYSPAF